jgi:hypothetical protein
MQVALPIRHGGLDRASALAPFVATLGCCRWIDYLFFSVARAILKRILL